MDFGQFEDGKATGPSNRNIKRNRELLDPDQAVTNLFMDAFREDVWCTALSIRHHTPPMFIEYDAVKDDQGHYDYHCDSAIMNGLRSDLVILTAINDTVYNGNATSSEQDLTKWANQGILLLNTALTTTVSKSGQHFKIWQPFTAYLFDCLNWHNSGIVYIYMGRKAEDWRDSVSDNNYKLIVSHPASAAYTKQQKWECNDVFNHTNKIMHDLYGEKIIW